MDKVTPIRRPEIVAGAGDPVDSSRLTLCVYGDDLEPDEITKLLGCTPTFCHRKGDPPKAGVPLSAPGSWLLTVEGRAAVGPDALIGELLDRLPERPELWARLRRRFRVRFFFGIFVKDWNRGFEISPQAVQRLAKVGIELGFDIYANLEHGG